MTAAERAAQFEERQVSAGRDRFQLWIDGDLLTEWERQASALPAGIDRVSRLNAVLRAWRDAYHQPAASAASEPAAVDLLADDPVSRVKGLYDRLDAIEEERRQIEGRELPAARIAADAYIAARQSAAAHATSPAPAPERDTASDPASVSLPPAASAAASEPATSPPAPATAPARKAPAALTCEPPAAAWGSPEMDAWVAAQMRVEVPAKVIAAALASIGITSPKYPGQPYSENAIGKARDRHHNYKTA